MVDLELATTDQLIMEFVKRQQAFLLLFPPRTTKMLGRKDWEGSMLHGYGLSPEEALALTEGAAEVIKNVVDGNAPPDGVQFFCRHVNDDGTFTDEFIEVDRSEFDTEDPWGEDDT